MPKRTYQPKPVVRKRALGFRARSKGKVLLKRRRKGRKHLSVA